MITQEYLKECITYNKNTGDVIRIERPRHHFSSIQGFTVANSKLTGEPVRVIQANSNGKSYYKYSLDHKHFLLHRIIWLFVTGEWPEFIDHKNGNGLCNIWVNLRNATMTQNNRNIRLYNTNTSGRVGVYFSKKYNNWYSCIWDKNKQYRIGTFDSFDEAKQARISEEIRLGYHKNHGEMRPL